MKALTDAVTALEVAADRLHAELQSRSAITRPFAVCANGDCVRYRELIQRAKEEATYYAATGRWPQKELTHG